MNTEGEYEMHCRELERLLEAHSALTLEYFRQEGRAEEFYASDEEWVGECKRLQELEEQLDRVTTDLADHRRRHHCGEQGAFNDGDGHRGSGPQVVSCDAGQAGD